MTTQATSTLDITTLQSLSPEARQTALEQSGLIRQWSAGADKDGLWIQDGVPKPNNIEQGWVPPFPTNLLSDSSPFKVEAQQILLGRNRVLLSGQLDKSLFFLQQQGDAVSHIRTLDILFDDDTLSAWMTTTRGQWEALAECIAERLNLAELELSLDAGEAFEAYEELQATEAQLPEVKVAYEGIVEVLKKALKGRKPKVFAVYWGAFHDLEAWAEKEIMGTEYDSATWEKIPSQRRNPFFPHGVPAEKLEWPRGMVLKG